MKYTTLTALFALLIAPLAWAEEPAPADETPLASREEILSPKDTDIVYGDPDAPVVFYEYASLSCPACGKFHTSVLPELKEKYIDSGKAAIRWRAYPHNPSAFYASLLVACLDTDQKARFANVLFELQDRWAFSDDYEAQLKKLALVGGVSAETFDQCMADKELETEVLNIRKEASDVLQIEGIPSFFLNGEKLEGSPLEASTFEAAIKANSN